MMSKKHLKVNGYASARQVCATYVITGLLLLVPIIVFAYGGGRGEHLVKKRNAAKLRADRAEQIEVRNNVTLTAMRNMPAITNNTPTPGQIQAYLLQVQAYLERNSTNGIGQVVVDSNNAQ